LPDFNRFDYRKSKPLTFVPLASANFAGKLTQQVLLGRQNSLWVAVKRNAVQMVCLMATQSSFGLYHLSG
jgi:hypothetical protein